MMYEIHVDRREGVRACEASTRASVSLLLRVSAPQKLGGQVTGGAVRRK